MHGNFVDIAISSAKAWVGTWRSRKDRDRDQYDGSVWREERSYDHLPVVLPEEASLLYEEPDFDMYEMARDVRVLHALAPMHESDYFDPKKRYPQLDDKTAAATTKVLLFLFGDRELRDIQWALDQPPVDGYLVGLFVLCGQDQLYPLVLHWRGKKLEPEELVGRVRRAVDTTSRLPTNPKVPSPVVPEEVLGLLRDSVERSSRSYVDRALKNSLVNSLLSLDRTNFLEALDRAVPWIENGELGWLDKDDEVSDKLWQILLEVPAMAGKLCLAPWKTALGLPRNLVVRVSEETSEGSSFGKRTPEVIRTPAGFTVRSTESSWR